MRKNPEKTSPRKPVPTGDRTRARCVTSAHATTCSTAVDDLKFYVFKVVSDNRVKYEIQLNSDMSEDGLINTETCKVLNNQLINNIKLV